MMGLTGRFPSIGDVPYLLAFADALRCFVARNVERNVAHFPD